jgi:hypothetical protein
MKKLSEEDKKAIVISHYLDNSNENIQRLCNQYDITKKSIYNVINKEENKQYIQQYKPNYTKNLDAIITKALERLTKQVDSEDIKALDLTKIIGILYDKIRLEEGLSTENKAIQINIKVEK